MSQITIDICCVKDRHNMSHKITRFVDFLVRMWSEITEDPEVRYIKASAPKRQKARIDFTLSSEHHYLKETIRTQSGKIIRRVRNSLFSGNSVDIEFIIYTTK